MGQHLTARGARTPGRRREGRIEVVSVSGFSHRVNSSRCLRLLTAAVRYGQRSSQFGGLIRMAPPDGCARTVFRVLLFPALVYRKLRASSLVRVNRYRISDFGLRNSRTVPERRRVVSIPSGVMSKQNPPSRREAQYRAVARPSSSIAPPGSAGDECPIDCALPRGHRSNLAVSMSLPSIRAMVSRP